MVRSILCTTLPVMCVIVCATCHMCGVSVLSLVVVFPIVIIDVCRVPHNMYAIICQVYGGLLVGCDVLVHVSDVLSRVSDVISLVYLILCRVRGVVSHVMRLCLLP